MISEPAPQWRSRYDAAATRLPGKRNGLYSGYLITPSTGLYVNSDRIIGSIGQINRKSMKTIKKQNLVHKQT